MMQHISVLTNVRRISPLDGDYFFGYYDLQPFSGNIHLAHRVPFADRLPRRDERAEIGIIHLGNGSFERLDTTAAWNFQQGAMLQWLPGRAGEEILYNCVADGELCTAILNIHTGKKRLLDRPVANVSPDGRYALSINFARLFDFRPGYGYATYGDPFYYQYHSREDGVFLIDLVTGKSQLILSLQELWELTGAHFSWDEQKLVINHVAFNTDGSRFLLLLRNFPASGQRHKTAIITANRDGKEVYLLSDYGVQSHYHWKNARQVIFYAGGRELRCARGWANNYLLTDLTHEGEAVADYYFQEDNHMSYSPDRKCLLTDSYPDEQNLQTLRLYDIAGDTLVQLGRFYSVSRPLIDLRCDLHPRWDETGGRVSFDSTHEGQRGLYLIETADIIDSVRAGNR